MCFIKCQVVVCLKSLRLRGYCKSLDISLVPTLLFSDFELYHKMVIDCSKCGMVVLLLTGLPYYGQQFCIAAQIFLEVK